MERLSKAGVIGLALSCFAGHVWAQGACMRAQDLTALQIAAVQQELMVAALTCDDVSLYNGFVVAYRKDLKTSDDALQAFFRRRDALTGTSDYHAFKTKMANAYSVRSADNKGAYCKNAQALFHAALGGKQSLSTFALAQPISVDESYMTCGDSVAGGAMVAGASANVAKTPEKTAAAKPPKHDALAFDQPKPPVAAAPHIAAAPAEPPVLEPYPLAPDSRDDYLPPSYYTRDDRAQRDASPPPIPYDSYARRDDDTHPPLDGPRQYQPRDFQPPAPPRPYDPRIASARGLYARAGGAYYDRYYGYPYYRDRYGRVWYGVPPQSYLWRR